MALPFLDLVILSLFELASAVATTIEAAPLASVLHKLTT